MHILFLTLQKVPYGSMGLFKKKCQNLYKGETKIFNNTILYIYAFLFSLIILFIYLIQKYKKAYFLFSIKIYI